MHNPPRKWGQNSCTWYTTVIKMRNGSDSDCIGLNPLSIRSELIKKKKLYFHIYASWVHDSYSPTTTKLFSHASLHLHLPFHLPILIHNRLLSILLRRQLPRRGRSPQNRDGQLCFVGEREEIVERIDRFLAQLEVSRAPTVSLIDLTHMAFNLGWSKPKRKENYN